MPDERWSAITFLLTEALLLVTALFLAVKALMFERRTHLGRALAHNNLAMSLVYCSAFVVVWLPMARHPLVAIPLRVLVAVTTYQALRAFAQAYGGWRGLWREVRASVREWWRDVRRAACAWRDGTPAIVQLVQVLLVLAMAAALVLGIQGWEPFG